MLRRLRLALALALGAALPAAAAAPARAAEPLAWVTPRSARVITWTDAPLTPPREVDPQKPLQLGPDDLLILPAEPGDRFQISGAVAAVGLGSGIADAPDVITWLPLPPPGPGDARRREIGVPPWSSARFLVLRAAPSNTSSPLSTVGVRAAARESAPLAWYRLDEDVADWILHNGPPPAALTASFTETGTAIAEARPLLRWVQAARDALAPAPGAPLPRPAATWLTARYVEESLRVRPLLEPYFVRRQVEVTGGSASPIIAAEEHATPWRAAVAPARISGSPPAGAELPAPPSPSRTAADPARVRLFAPGADVVRLGLRARARGPARVVVRAGGAVVRVIAWRFSPRLADPDRWGPPQWIRVPLPVAARDVTVEVIQGEVAVAAEAYHQRVGVADFFSARRARAALLDEAAADTAGLPGALAAADRHPTLAATRAALAAAARAPASPRALVLGESVRWAASPAEARARALDAFAAARTLPDAAAAPLLRATLERLAAAHVDPLPPPAPWSGWAATTPVRPDVHPDDAAALAALGQSIGPPADGRRPVGGPPADRYAAEHGEVPGAARRARQAWAREAGWDALDAGPGASLWSSVEVARDVLPEPGATEPPQCDVEGPHGLRWTVLDAERARITVDAPQGAYARILFRGLSIAPEPESLVRIDGLPVSVHAGAGVASVVAVAPGDRLFERRAGAPPVLARIPRPGKALCAGLRDITQWAWVQREATFTVPDRERATVARVIVAPSSVADEAQPGEAPHPRPHRMLLSTGPAATYEAWVRPGATGAVEIPVPVGAGALRIRTEAGVLLRASARLHPAAPPAPRTISPRTAPAPGDAEKLLHTVRMTTRALRGAPAKQRLPIKEQRASALDLLGFPSLAELDRPPVPEDGDLDAEVAPSATFSLPPGSPSVVPLGLLARLTPLPLPGDLDPLRTARDARRAGEPARAIAALAPAAERSAGADALLLALLAERAGEARLGEQAFLRIGLAHREPRALARAANLATDVASQSGDRLDTLRAFAIAELAAQSAEAAARAGAPWLDPPPAALARLAPVIAWRAPPRVDRTAGTASLDVRARPERDLPLRVRVRRALVDAPEAGLIVTEGAHAEFRLDRPRPVSLVLDGTCRLLDHVETPCALSVRLDGEPVACKPVAAAAAPSSPGSGGAPPPSGDLRCAVAVPAGKHRVEVRPPPDVQLLAWVRATPQGEGGAPYPGRVMSTWSDIDPARPLELTFAGPTVVRIRARPAYECADGDKVAPGDDVTCHPSVTTTAAGAALRYEVTALGDDGAPSAAPAPEGAGELPLDPSEDLSARRAGVLRPPFFWLGNEVEQRVAVIPEGAHVVRVSSPAGRALVRVEIAVPTGTPRPRTPPPPPPPPLPEPEADAGLPWAPRVGEDPDYQAFPIGVYAQLLDQNLTDEDLTAGTRTLELGVDVHRELVERRVWAATAAFGRLRVGVPSIGVQARLDTAGSGAVPALDLLGRLVVQPPGVGGRISLGATWTIPVDEIALQPWASVALLGIDESRRGASAVDRDVFTPYAAEHLSQANFGARLRLRPAVDAILSLGPSVRVSPLFSTLDGEDLRSTVDRVDLRADVDVLAGRGLFPWIQAGWLTSYRPVNPTREESFIRNGVTTSVTFWRWLGVSGHRLLLSGELALLIDSPSTSLGSPRLGAGLLARYDWTAGRGLRDWPPRDTPFRDRLEEGSGVIEREPPAAEPLWDAED